MWYIKIILAQLFYTYIHLILICSIYMILIKKFIFLIKKLQ